MTSRKSSPAPKPVSIVLLLAVRDAYLRWDQEDYCEKGIKRCGKCWGCAQYRVLQKAFAVVKKMIPKQAQ